MRIGALADRSGITAQAIRYYESIELLPAPERTPSGYRDYGADAVERLRFIRDAQASGLTLVEVQSLLRMKDAGDTTCAHTRAFLERHLADIDEQIARLQQSRAEMVELVERARRLDPADCTDPNRCQVVSDT
jgi:MerR family transcriptional regulator, copper efflux regulator